eukprot:5444351-Karenia_brevis.AAC.1
MELDARWTVMPEDGAFMAKAWIDGSALNPEDELLCRAGWSVVAVDAAGAVTGELIGNLPGMLQGSGEAE